jgi:helicase
LRVEELPISDQIKHILTEKGYSELYPPQADAMAAGALLGKNIVLASPTASGKTLVAELAILRRVTEGQGKALYLTPLRALASEKYDDFQRYSDVMKSDGHKVRIAITSGDYDRSDERLGNYDVVIATNEKADSLLRHRAKWISDVALVVADEVHLLNEAARGPTLEVVITRLRKLNPNIQLLALSATVRNAAEVADWIRASAITTEWRPVPLKEGVYCQNEIHFKDGSSKTIQPFTGNPIMDIALQTLHEGGQALLFTETRRSAVQMGKRAAAVLGKVVSPKEKRSSELIAHRIRTSGEKTRLSDMLADQVTQGAGFHHAGLHSAHRRIVEDAFREGKIKILAATPTLAAGVNLPARLVVITSHERYEAGYGRYPISVLEYKQFCGRAGRPKYDEYGEAVLIAQTDEERDALLENYVLAEPERLWSRLGVEKVLRPHVLSTIATGFAHSEEGLRDFFSSTFYAYQYGPRAIGSRLADILKYLAKEEMIAYDKRELIATRFGRRVSELYIDPVSAVVIRDGLYRRATSPTDFSYLHLIARTPDIAPRIYPRRGEDEKLAAMAAERSDQFMCEVPDELLGSFDPGYEDFLSEVKTAAVLLDWVEETSEDAILSTHRVEPGDLMRLVQIADWLLYSAYELAVLFGHKDLRKPLGQLRLRVEKGTKADVIPLLSLQGVGRVRARALHNAGFKTIEDLRKASPSELATVPLIGTKLAKKIKEQAGGLIKSEEWEKIRSARDETEQSLLTEYSNSDEAAS